MRIKKLPQKEKIMISEITAAVQGAKALGDILKATHELKDSNTLVAAVSDHYAKLIVAQTAVMASHEKQLTLTNRVSDLEKKIVELEDWNREAERYKLTELCTDVVAFTLKPGMENGEPPHKLCTACFGKRQKGYLNRTNMNVAGTFYTCNLCNKEIIDRVHTSTPQPPTIMKPERF
jgi:hypothetical protein